jgi:hypothetical protein
MFTQALRRGNKYIPSRSPPPDGDGIKPHISEVIAFPARLPSTPSLCMQARHRKKGNTKIQSYVDGRSTTKIDK